MRMLSTPTPLPSACRRLLQFVTASRRSLFGAIVLRFPPALQPPVYMAVHQ